MENIEERLLTYYPSGKIFFFNIFSNNEMNIVMEECNKNEFSIALVIYNVIEIKGKKLSLLKKLCNIRLFERRHLLILLKGHRLIPEHVQLDEQQRDSFLKRYQEDKLPLIPENDPIVYLMGFKIGDILKIQRKDGSIYFRLVVSED